MEKPTPRGLCGKDDEPVVHAPFQKDAAAEVPLTVDPPPENFVTRHANVAEDRAELGAYDSPIWRAKHGTTCEP